MEAFIQIYGALALVVGAIMFMANDNPENMARLRMNLQTLLLWCILFGLFWPVTSLWVISLGFKRRGRP